MESSLSYPVWNLPPTVINNYRNKQNITNFRLDQLNVLQSIFKSNDKTNILILAPTSSGKTLICDIIIINTIIKNNFTRKVLYLMPYNAIVSEKQKYYHQIYGDIIKKSNTDEHAFHFRAFLPNDNSYALFNHNVHVGLCTIEKANIVVNNLLLNNNIKSLSTIAIDEFDMINNADRGFIIELLVTKFRYLQKQNNNQLSILGLSATLPKNQDLSEWLDASLFFSDPSSRPLSIRKYVIYISSSKYIAKEFLVDDSGTFNFASTPTCPKLNYPDKSLLSGYRFTLKDYVIYQLVKDTILSKQTALIFCQTKDRCEEICALLSKSLLKEKLDFSQSQKQKRRELFLSLRGLGNAFEKINESHKWGIAYHHGGLTTDEKAIIQNGFYNGTLSILACTTTLSSGVNLPVIRVIFDSLKSGQNHIDVADFQQMMGRAGRNNTLTNITYGLCYVIANENQMHIESLLSSSIPTFISPLFAEILHLQRMIIEGIIVIFQSELSKLINSLTIQLDFRQNIQVSLFSLKKYIECSWYYFQCSRKVINQNFNLEKAQFAYNKEYNIQNIQELHRARDAYINTENQVDRDITTSLLKLQKCGFIEIIENNDTKIALTRSGFAFFKSGISLHEAIMIKNTFESSEKQFFIINNKLHILSHIVSISNFVMTIPILERFKLRLKIWEEQKQNPSLGYLSLFAKRCLAVAKLSRIESGQIETFIAQRTTFNRFDLLHVRYAKFYLAICCNLLLRNTSDVNIANDYLLQSGQVQSLRINTEINGRMIMKYLHEIGKFEYEIIVSNCCDSLNTDLNKRLEVLRKSIPLKFLLAMQKRGFTTVNAISKLHVHEIFLILKNSSPFDYVGSKEISVNNNLKSTNNNIFSTDDSLINEILSVRNDKLLMNISQEIHESSLNIVNKRNAAASKKRKLV